MGLKVRAKSYPHNWHRIKEALNENKIAFDLRQLETLTLVNTETGEELECDVTGLKVVESFEAHVLKFFEADAFGDTIDWKNLVVLFVLAPKF